MLAITVGSGLKNPIGRYQKIEPPSPAALSSFLATIPPTIENWWSGHLWKENRRGTNNWQATNVITTDIDYENEIAPPKASVDRLAEMAKSGQLPGNLFHLTPHGARIGFVLSDPCTNRDEILKAAEVCDTLLKRALIGTGYKVDTACTRDLARLYYTPNTIAKGAERRADVITMRDEPYVIDDLVAQWVDPGPPSQTKKPTPIRGEGTFEQLAEQWVFDHPRDYPKRPSRCPVCDDSGSFKVMPNSDLRWACFSSDHVEVGIKGEKVWHGDALDLEAHERGLKPIDVLRADGYVKPPAVRPSNTVRVTNGRSINTNGTSTATVSSREAEPETPPPSGETESTFRAWRSRSYLTAVDIISKNARDVLEGRRLRLNEMTGQVELLRSKPIRDADLHRIRSLIEQRFVGGTTKDGRELGLQLSQADIFAAADQVATENQYHPVREYLEALKWDRQARIARVCEEVLNVPATPLNMMIVQCLFVSAVARVMKPGCKVDAMVVLVGRQGIGKSTFFKILAGREWFIDSPIDIEHKDGFQVLRNGWIIEWAELESLFRARDPGAVKAFLSSCEDTYRPSHGRQVQVVPRSCIIVGTLNPEEFLTDETGNRRFWPLSVKGEINNTLLAEWRDQLWAEAVYLHSIGTLHWLSPEMERQLENKQDDHRVRDVWENLVLTWAAKQTVAFTTGSAIYGALEKPPGQWTRADEMRVSRILRYAGLERKTDNLSAGCPKKWYKK